MRKVNIYCVLLVILSVIGIASCEEEESLIFDDVHPVEFLFYVIDEDSVNLLNDSTKMKEYMGKVKVIYNNTEYKCTKIEHYNNINQTDSIKSRWYAPFFKGLIMYDEGSFFSDDYVLYFGEFDGGLSYNEISFTLDWGDGTTDDIYYKGGYNNMKSNREFYLNGELKQKGINPVFKYKFIK